MLDGCVWRFRQGRRTFRQHPRLRAWWHDHIFVLQRAGFRNQNPLDHSVVAQGAFHLDRFAGNRVRGDDRAVVGGGQLMAGNS